MASTRIGLIFFSVYLACYSAFVGISAFAPSLLEHEIGGVTLAIHSGLALILGAIVLAVLYCWLHRGQAST